jgi:hypothetical protein
MFNLNRHHDKFIDQLDNITHKITNESLRTNVYRNLFFIHRKKIFCMYSQAIPLSNELSAMPSA